MKQLIVLVVLGVAAPVVKVVQARRGGGGRGRYVCSYGARPVCADGAPPQWKYCSDGSKPQNCSDGNPPTKVGGFGGLHGHYRCADGNKTVCSDLSTPVFGNIPYLLIPLSCLHQQVTGVFPPVLILNLPRPVQMAALPPS